MRAVIVTKGPPRRAELVSRPEPADPRGREVLIRVSASSVNGTDMHLVRGSLPTLPGRDVALGFDLAGEVIARGDRVTAFDVGDRVVGLLGHGGGGHAERVVVAQHALALAPAEVSLTDAAALPLAGLTALQALSGSGALGRTPRPRMLVIGAAGGIGSFAVQLAVLAGAEVTATASGDRHGYLRGLGAREVVDTREVPPGRYDVILDVPTTLTLRTARAHLTERGTLVSLRPVSVDAIRSVVHSSGHRVVVVATRRDGQELARLVRLVDSQRLRIPVDSVFTLDDVVRAHERLGSGEVRGKVVLQV